MQHPYFVLHARGLVETFCGGIAEADDELGCS